jgi:hypothetical protein
MVHKLSKRQQELLARIIETGDYENADEAMTTILEQELEDSVELAEIRAALQIGLDQRSNGEFIEYTPEWRAVKLRQVLEQVEQSRKSA